MAGITTSGTAMFSSPALVSIAYPTPRPSTRVFLRFHPFGRFGVHRLGPLIGICFHSLESRPGLDTASCIYRVRPFTS